MRILLVGQAALAEEVLRGLEAAGDTIAAVVCPPDAGTKPDPVKATEVARGIPVHQFRSLKVPEARQAFEAADADLGLLAYVTQIVPEPYLHIQRRASLCFHPSIHALHGLSLGSSEVTLELAVAPCTLEPPVEAYRVRSFPAGPVPVVHVPVVADA